MDLDRPQLERLALDYGFDPSALPAGAQAAIAALCDRLQQALDLADSDSLTGALNRRAFLREVSRTLSYLNRYGGEATVVFLDLDGFKAINDTYGHAAGDAALRGAAFCLRAHIRESDVIGRLGGDEFAILLAHTGPQEALAKIGELSERLTATPVPYEGRALHVRATFGCHTLRPTDCAETAIARADEAMYARRALQRGRTRRRRTQPGQPTAAT